MEGVYVAPGGFGEAGGDVVPGLAGVFGAVELAVDATTRAFADRGEEAVWVFRVYGDRAAVVVWEAFGSVHPGLSPVFADVNGVGSIGIDAVIGFRAGGDLVDVFVQVGRDGFPGGAVVRGTHNTAYVDVCIDPAVGGAGEAAHGRGAAPGGVPVVAAVEFVEGFQAFGCAVLDPIDMWAFRTYEEVRGIFFQDEEGFNGFFDAGGEVAGSR